MKITAIELVVGKLCQMYVLIKISQWEADELSRAHSSSSKWSHNRFQSPPWKLSQFGFHY